MTDTSVDTSVIGESAVSKLTRRLMLLFVLMFFVNYLDRTNIGIAALDMNQDLHLSPVDYGFSAGIFSIAYAVFGIPSNVFFHRIGPRKWLGWITIAWGIIAFCTGFVFDKTSLNAARLLLGVAEAGFFPGVILYLTQWYPASARARALTLFTLGNLFATVFGGPISASILVLPNLGLGLHNWQWLFIIEAVPAILLGLVVFVRLDDRPADAGWLTGPEKAWLEQQLALEDRGKGQVQAGALGAFRSPATLALSLAKFLVLSAQLGVLLWLPQIIASLGHLNSFEISLVNGVPFLLAAIAGVVIGRHSDKVNERTFHIAVPALIGALGFVAAAATDNLVVGGIGICLATIGIWVSNTIAWTLPSRYLTGAALASGIALVNSVGNLGGFFGPFIVGWLKEMTGGYRRPLLVLGACLALNGVIILVLHLNRQGKTARAAASTTVRL